MRDAPAHGTEILGGMWGGWNRFNDLYRRVRERIIKVTQWRFKVSSAAEELDEVPSHSAFACFTVNSSDTGCRVLFYIEACFALYNLFYSFLAYCSMLLRS